MSLKWNLFLYHRLTYLLLFQIQVDNLWLFGCHCNGLASVGRKLDGWSRKVSVDCWGPNIVSINSLSSPIAITQTPINIIMDDADEVRKNIKLHNGIKTFRKFATVWKLYKSCLKVSSPVYKTRCIQLTNHNS